MGNLYIILIKNFYNYILSENIFKVKNTLFGIDPSIY